MLGNPFDGTAQSSAHTWYASHRCWQRTPENASALMLCMLVSPTNRILDSMCDTLLDPFRFILVFFFFSSVVSNGKRLYVTCAYNLVEFIVWYNFSWWQNVLFCDNELYAAAFVHLLHIFRFIRNSTKIYWAYITAGQRRILGFFVLLLLWTECVLFDLCEWILHWQDILSFLIFFFSQF